MSKRKNRHSPKKRMPKKLKIFLVRAAVATVVFLCLIAAKSFIPDLAFYVKNQISYNANLESAKQTAKEVILKYSPTAFRQAEH